MAVTLGRFLQEARSRLAPASPTPRLDAELLVMQVTGLNRAALIARDNQPLEPQMLVRLRELLARRERGEPVAYLLGQREFWSLTLQVTPDVLIPRPETEHLVEEALRRIPDSMHLDIADLGTGSGAIALAIARERPRCHVVATDASAAALDVARRNAGRLELGNIEFRHGDWLAALGKDAFDVVVSNPPYVRAGDPHLREGDVRFEPQTALVSGADGLDDIRRIVATAPARLKPGGWLLLEHGHDQGTVVRHLLAQQGLDHVTTVRDLAGHERVSGGQRPAGNP